MQTFRRPIALLLVLALFLTSSGCASTVSGEPAPRTGAQPEMALGAPSEASALSVQIGEVRGTALDLDGRTPIPGARVRLVDATGAVVREATTGPTGAFALSSVAEGRYILGVGQARANLSASSSAERSDLKLVLDSDVALGQRVERTAGAGQASDDSTPIIVVAIVVGAVVIGVCIVVAALIWPTPKHENVFIGGNSPTVVTPPGKP